MDISLETLLPLIPAFPLGAAVLIAVLGPRILRSRSHWLAILALVGATFCSLLLVYQVYVTQQQRDGASASGFEQTVTLWEWAHVGDALTHPGEPGADHQAVARGGMRDFRVDITLRADALTAMMLAMVTFVSTLVTIFAAGYMHGDRGYWRFFAYICLFVFSMTMLVSVSNFVLLFVFWEAVGLCSYLLIGFWYEKPEASAAGKKAFLVNRVGDFGFTLALFLIWINYGTLNFHDSPPQQTEAASVADTAPAVPGVLGKARISSGDYVVGEHGRVTLLAICLLLMLGACGKRPQFPLHVWLPDAMEGPTPVSALIHAATMVTAGVYMVARCTPLFAASPDAQLIVALIGVFTALLAGLIALTQFDLKRVLAYSTISQLGYMFVGLGVGTLAGITAGMFHLFTHAFFKALLFLGAGSVMHAMGNIIDMRRFGGLRKLMPITYTTFLIGCLALSGIPPFAGFWSKDSIVASVHDKMHALKHGQSGHDGTHGAVDRTDVHFVSTHAVSAADEQSRSVLGLSDAQIAALYTVIYYAAMVTALLTAFYTFRAFLMTFHGDELIPEEAGHHAHESPRWMCVPLMVLALFAVVVGMAFDWTLPAKTHPFARFLEHTPSLAAGAISETERLESFHYSVAGLSTVIALVGSGMALLLYLGNPRRLESLVRFFKCERVPSLSSVSPYKLSFNKFFFDEIYDALIVRPLRGLAKLSYFVDCDVVDRLVNFCGFVPRAVGGVMRSLQLGLVQFYALATIVGIVIIIAVKLLWMPN